MTAALKQNPNQVFIDKDFINTFAQSVINTHNITAHATLKPGQPRVCPKLEKHGEISGFVGIVSNGTRWILALSYTTKAALQVYELMFSEKKEALDNDISDLIGEITNQVYGSAKTLLNQRGYSFEMALPTVVMGDFKTHYHGAGATLTIPFQVAPGTDELYIDITLEK